MKRNLKALGLALVAAFAMSAVAASGASALSVFDATKLPVTLTGEQEGTDVFKIQGGEVKCEVAKYKATAAEKVTSLTVTPSYEKCKAFGLEATIHMNGCTYTFTPGEHTTGKETWHGSVDIVCPKDKDITITAPSSGNVCVVHVPPQNDLTTVTYTNIPAGGETKEHYVTVDVNITKIHYTETEISKLFCPGTHNFTGEDGTYVGKAFVKGYEDLGTHEISPGVFTHTEGKEVGIEVKTINT